MAIAEFLVSGMTCSHCEASIREEVSAIPGVKAVEVSAASGRLVVTSADSVTTEQIANAVTVAGYSASAV